MLCSRWTYKTQSLVVSGSEQAEYNLVKHRRRGKQGEEGACPEGLITKCGLAREQGPESHAKVKTAKEGEVSFAAHPKRGKFGKRGEKPLGDCKRILLRHPKGKRLLPTRTAGGR